MFKDEVNLESGIGVGCPKWCLYPFPSTSKFNLSFAVIHGQDKRKLPFKLLNKFNLSFETGNDKDTVKGA